MKVTWLGISVNISMLHMQELYIYFLDECVEMGDLVTDVCFFVREKEHLFSKNFHEYII